MRPLSKYSLYWEIQAWTHNPLFSVLLSSFRVSFSCAPWYGSITSSLHFVQPRASICTERHGSSITPNFSENSLRVFPHARRSKKESEIWELNRSCFFSPHLSLCRAERPPHLKLNEGGVVPVHYNDIQAPFIQPLSNGLWTANAPPSGGRSPLITPPNPNKQTPTIAPTKERGESAPVVRTAAPGFLRYAGKISCAFEWY